MGKIVYNCGEMELVGLAIIEDIKMGRVCLIQGLKL